MNKQKKNAILFGIIILLLPACGQLEIKPTSTDTPEPIVILTESSTSTLVAVSTERAVPENSKYLGLNYPPLPDNLAQGFSILIQETNEHSLSLVSDGANRMLWLSKMTRSDSSAQASWEIKDILELSNVEPGLILVPDGCFLHGQPDSEIFVFGKSGRILWAWRANTSLNVFEAISTDGIECRSDKAMNLN